MSKIDQRVVEMRFNNKQFESGAQTSIKTLDSLKKSLNLEGAAAQLTGLHNAGKAFSLDGMATGIDSIADRFSTMGIIGATVLVDLTRSALNFTKSMVNNVTGMIVQGGKQRALNIEQARFQFQGLGMDVEAAMDDALYAVTDTAYGLDEAAKAAAMLGASGVELGDDMKGALRAISGVAAMTNAEYSDISHVFTTVAGQGKLMTMQLRQLENRGMNVAAIMGESMGKTEEAVREMVTAGEIDFETFYTIMDDTFGEHATKANETYAGSLRNVKANLSNLGAKVQTAYLENMRLVFVALIQVIKDIGVVLDPLIERFGKFGKTIAESVSGSIANMDFAFLAPMVESITNLFKSLMSVMKPIAKAFSDIFPAKTPKGMVSMMEGLQKFTESMVLGHTNSERLRSAFKGIFAVADLVATGFLAIVKAVFPLAQSGGGAFLAIAGSIGDLTVKFRDFVKESAFIQGAFRTVGDVLSAISDVISGTVDSISKAFSKIADADTDGIEETGSRLERIATPFKFLGNLLLGFGEVVGKAITKLTPLFSGFFEVVGEGLSKAKEKIIGWLDDLNFDKTLDLLNTGFFGLIALSIKKFVDNLSKSTSEGPGIIQGIKDIIGGITGALSAMQTKLKADTLIKIAGALAILTVSVVALSMIDSDKLAGALGAVSVLLVELFASLAVFEKILAGGGFKGMIKVTAGLLALSTAVLLLSFATKKLGDLDWDELAKGLLGVGALLGMLTLTAKALSTDSGKMIKGASGLILFAAAINVLASAVKKMGDMDLATMGKGLAGVGVILLELSLFLNLTDFDGMGLLKGVGILLLATAMNSLAKAVGKFGDMDTSAMTQGLIGVATVLTQVTIFSKVAGGGKMVTTAASMLILSAALKVMSSVLKTLGGMTWGEIAKGLVTLAGALTVIGVAMALMTAGLAGAAALVVIAGALAILTPVLKILGEMSLGEIGMALVALAGTFTVLGVAGLVLTPLIPTILALAGSLTLLGVGVTLIGGGIALLAAGFTALAAAGTAGTVVLVGALTGIIGLIPLFVTAVGQGLVQLLGVIASSGVAIAEAISTILTAVLTAIKENAPLLMETVKEIILSLLDAIQEVVPEIVETGLAIIVALLEGLRDGIPEIVSLATEIIVAFIDSIAESIPDIVQAGVDMILAFINGLADSIRDNTPLMIEAIDNLMDAIIEAGVEVLLASIGRYKELWHLIMESAFVQGIKDKINNVITAIKEAPSKGLEAIQSFLGRFKERGSELMGRLGGGIKEKVGDVVESAKSAPTRALTALKGFVSDFTTMGGEMIAGMAKGITDKVGDVVEAAKGVASSALEGAKKLLRIESPSREFRDKVGGMIGDGMAIGMDEKRPKVEKSGAALGSSSVEGAAKGIAKGKPKVVKAANDVGLGSYEATKEWIDKQKKYFELSLEDELSKWKAIQSKYKAGSEERLEIDKNISDLRIAIKRAEYDHSMKWIDDQKYYKLMSLQEELEAWERVHARYMEGTAEHAKAERELFRLRIDLKKEEYDHSMSWIDEEKYYKRLSLGEELAAYERVQARYEKGTDEFKKMEREKYRVQSELNDKKKKLDEDYRLAQNKIHDDLKKNIKELNDAYDSALKNRTKTLVDSYGLFDAVTRSDTPVTGTELLQNLTDQTEDFESWQKNLAQLSGRGISSALHDELQEMGPKSLEQIKALNQLSGPELEKYSQMYAKKHQQAKQQATNELEDLRYSTRKQIRRLKDESYDELDAVREAWNEQTDALTRGVLHRHDDMNYSMVQGTKNMSQDTRVEFVNLSKTLQHIMESPNWEGAGKSIIERITEGIKEAKEILIKEMTDIAKEAMEAASAILTRPSRSTSSRVSIGTSGGGYVNVGSSSGSKNPGISVSGPGVDHSSSIPSPPDGYRISSKAPVTVMSSGTSNMSIRAASMSLDSVDSIERSGGGDTKTSSVSFTQNNYSPKALSRSDIYRQTKNQISSVKGVLG